MNQRRDFDNWTRSTVGLLACGLALLLSCSERNSALGTCEKGECEPAGTAGKSGSSGTGGAAIGGAGTAQGGAAGSGAVAGSLIGGSAGVLNPCMDVFVSPKSTLNADDSCEKNEGDWCNGAISVGTYTLDGDGLEVGWMGTRYSEKITNPSSGGMSHRWLGITSVANGEIKETSLFDLIPQHVGTSRGEYLKVSNGRDGIRAVLVSWSATYGEVASQYLYLIVGDAVVSQSVVAAPDALPVAVHVGWDGEAFVVHGYGGYEQVPGVYGRPLMMRRVSEQGEIVQDWTLFGSTPNVGYGDDGFKVSTDPVSGYSYVLDGSLLSGHDRQGNPLEIIKDYVAVDVSLGLAGSGANQPSVASDTSGAWVAFDRLDSFFVVRVDQKGQNVTDAFRLELPEDDPRGRFSGYTIISHSEESATLVASSGARLYTYPVTPQGIGEPNIVYEITEYKTTPTGLVLPILVTAASMSGVAIDGHDFVAFTTQTEGEFHVVRALQVDPGCTYEAWPSH